VFAAQHYAFQIALPTSQRRGSALPSSRKDQARKAFEKLAKRCLPASYAELARAIEREAREHNERRGDPLTSLGEVCTDRLGAPRGAHRSSYRDPPQSLPGRRAPGGVAG
jgi:hypothetical protein